MKGSHFFRLEMEDLQVAHDEVSRFLGIFLGCLEDLVKSMFQCHKNLCLA